MRTLFIVCAVAVVQIACEVTLVQWYATSSSPYDAQTRLSPIASAHLYKGSAMDDYEDFDCESAWGGWVYSVGYLQNGNNPPCGTATGSYFIVTTSSTGAPIQLTRAIVGKLGGQGFWGGSACFDSQFCWKINSGGYAAGLHFTAQEDHIYDATQTFSGVTLPASTTFTFTLNALGPAYYQNFYSFTLYGLLGCFPTTITSGTNSCPSGTGVLSGTACTLSCPVGYYINGNGATTCTDGTWSPSPASTCTANTTFCAVPANPSQGTLTCGRQLVPTAGTCTLACNAGYYVSTASIATCTSSHSYSGTTGACALNNTYCAVLPTVPAHGSQVSCQQYLGGQCKYACGPGYIISSDTLTCATATNVLGTYTGSAVICTANTTYCPLPAAPGNGTIGVCSQTVLGVCNFACNTGFYGANLARSCVAGSIYNGSLTTCTRNETFCPLPAVPGNGSRPSCDTFFGGVCHFACNGGWTATGTTRTCQANGQFSGSPIACLQNTGLCKVPAAPANGVTVSCSTILDGICAFQCNPGYSIDVSTRTCNISGNFSLPAPTCTLIPDYCPEAPEPVNGTVGACTRSIGGTCSFQCDTGFTATTALSWTCQAGPAWSDSVVSCAITAGFCPTPSSNGLNGIWGTCPGTLGSECELLCNRGYQLGDANPTCTIDGTFTAATACVKTPFYCPIAPMYGNATLVACGNTVGDTCTVQCNSGFNGGGTVACLESTAYSTATPCTPSPNFCPAPFLNNGVVGTCSAALGGVCTFACNPGYAFSAANSSVCNLNAHYSPDVTCDLITNFCAPLSPPNNGSEGVCSHALQGACSFDCDPGFSANTAAKTRYCQANAQYDGIDLVCTLSPDYCAPGTVTHGSIGSCNRTLGASCEFLCDQGYAPARTVRTCELGGSFSGPGVTCNLVGDYCPVPTAPQNGGVDSSCVTSVTGQCLVTCKSGYVPAQTVLTCQADGTFSPQNVTCTPVSCNIDEVPEVTHGSVACTGSTFGSTCTYTCDSGYDLTGTATRTCLSTRFWSGVDDVACTATAVGKTQTTGGQDALVTPPSTPSSPLNGNLPIVLGAVGGAIVLVVIILIIVVLRRRGPTRRKYPSSRESVGSATIRLDSAQDGNADRVNMMLAARSTTRIGAGAFSGVYKAKMEDDTWVAVKMLENTQDLSAQEFHREVTILGQLGQRNHNNVVRLVFFCPSPPAIVTELCDGGSLYNILLNEKLDVPTKKVILTQVASGMAFLHDCNIVHLDLKPENILRGENSQFKITDFGTSLILGLDVFLGPDGCCPPPRFVGTPQYSAPERLQNAPLDLRRCDVFSYGALMWRAFSEKAPYEDVKVETLIQSYAQRSRQSIDEFAPPKDMPEEMVKLMQRCQDLDFRARPYFDEVCETLGVQKTRRAQSSSSAVRSTSYIGNPVFDMSTVASSYDPNVGDLASSASSVASHNGLLAYQQAPPNPTTTPNPEPAHVPY